jgi:hypothetical protein
MAANGAFEEALRLVLETSGTEGVEALQQAVLEMGDASEQALAETARLADALVQLDTVAGKTEGYASMLGQLAEVQQQFDANQKAAYQLSLQLGSTDKPSKEMLNAQRQLRAEGDKLRKALDEQGLSLSTVGRELSALGVNTSRLADEQARLRAEAQRGAAALAEQARQAAADGAAARRRNELLEEGDARMRQQAESSRAAAKSLADYRLRAREAAAGSEELARSTDVAAGVMGRLRGLFAGALSFIGLNKAADGLKSIIKEGSDAEQEVAQLEATLAATGRQAEFTAESLAEMRKQLQGGLFDDGQISAAQVRLLSYTNIVGAQFPAAMQIAIDQAQRLGISLESSAETVGKALQTPSKAMESLSKQGFTLDASQKQLITQLEATGRVAEAQAIILDLLAESYGGAAAAAKVGTIAGLWKAATDSFKDWKQEIADQGVLTYFKAQLSEILATADRLARDGTLVRWAKQTADSIITLANAAKGAAQFMYDHGAAVVYMAKAYAALTLVRALVQLNAWRVGLVAATRAQWANVAAMDAAGKGAVTLGNVLKRIPTAIPITIALVGLDLAVRGVSEMLDALDKELDNNSASAKAVGEAYRRTREQIYLNAIASREKATALNELSKVMVKSAEEVALLGEAERQAYSDRLAGLQQYLDAQFGYLNRLEQLKIANEEQLADLATVESRLAAVGKGYRDLAQGAKVASDAMQGGIAASVQLVIEKLQGIDGDAKLAKESIGNLFKNLNFADTDSLSNVGLALSFISDKGAEAERNVKDGLLEALRQLSGDELSRFQAAAQAAFAELPAQAGNTAAVLEQTLFAAMEKLGVAAERMGVNFTAAGRDAIASFGAITENALATSAQVETAFKAALGRVSTLEEAKTLGSLLEAAGRRGKVGFDQAERSAAALNSRIRDITAAMNPLADEFGRLGIQSQASLNAARDSAKESFDAIRNGAAQGKASIEDVRRAFRAYADTAKAAAADSDSWQQAQVQSQLDVMGAIYQTGDAYEKMGESGRAAMAKVERGALDGRAAVIDLGNSAAQASADVDGLGSAAADAGSKVQEASNATAGFSLNLGEMSEKAREAITSAKGLAEFATVWNGLAQQRRELAKYTEELERSTKATDGLDQKRQELASRFDLLGEGDFEKVLQLEGQIAQQQSQRDQASRQAAEDRRKAVQAELEAQERADEARIGKAGGTETLIIDWRAPKREVVAAESAAEHEQAERLASLVAARVLDRIARSRSVSIKGRGR